MEQIIQTEFGKGGERFKNISTPLTELNKVPIENLFEKNGKFYYTTNGEEKNISTKETAFIDMVADIELLKEEDTFICMSDMTLPTIPTIKAKQNNVYMVLTASPDLEVSFIGNINPKDYATTTQLTEVENKIPTNNTQLANGENFIKNEKNAYDYDNLKNKPIIPEGAKLYSTTGQNTDGAMTQKVVTDNLELKASKKYVDDKFAGLGNIFVIKGAVASKKNLPTENNKIGDVWYVQDEKAGYVWIDDKGTLRWEQLGAEFNVDLSDYYTISQVDDKFATITRLTEVENKIPTNLSELTEDDTHQTITATEKSNLQGVLDNTITIKNANGGFAAGEGAIYTENGSVIGKEAETHTGGTSIGFKAFSEHQGIAIGDLSKSFNRYGVAIGRGSSVKDIAGVAIGNGAAIKSGGSVVAGVSIGSGSKAGEGVSIGVNAQTKYNGTSYIDAIQLGTGTNEIEKSLQVYNDNIYDSVNHKLTVNNIELNGTDINTTFAKKSEIPTVPTALSQLTSDSTHRTVTDTEKTTWNNKFDANNLPNKVKDIGNNTAITFQYSSGGKTAADYYTVWDGYKLTYISKASAKGDLGCPIDVGSNYVRFGDGTQLCWGQGPKGNGTRANITFPKPFVNTNYGIVVNMNRSGNTGNGWNYIQSRETTYATVVCGTDTTTYIAIGRWA